MLAISFEPAPVEQFVRFVSAIVRPFHNASVSVDNGSLIVII
jgi:hypothetical protein